MPKGQRLEISKSKGVPVIYLIQFVVQYNTYSVLRGLYYLLTTDLLHVLTLLVSILEISLIQWTIMLQLQATCG